MATTDPPWRRQFRGRIQGLITERSAGRGDPVRVERAEVEDVGASLGMKSDESSREFLALHGTLWTTATPEEGLEAAKETSGESRTNPPPRNWAALDGVVLL